MRTRGLDARTVARAEQVRLSLLPAVEARDALAAANAAKSAEIARLTAELERARSAAVARSTASRGGRRTSVAPARAVGPCGGWAALVGSYAWPVATMCSVLVCESGGNPNARNGSHNGLFQIAGGPFDPAANVRLAFSMWQHRGTQPWDASASCWG